MVCQQQQQRNGQCPISLSTRGFHVAVVWFLLMTTFAHSFTTTPSFCRPSTTTRHSTRRTSSLAVSSPRPMQQHKRRSSFEERMRDMVFGGERRKKRRTTLPRNVEIVETLDDYKRVVGDERDRIVCVRFYAPWCKACKATRPLYYHLANKYHNVLFVDVPVTESNARLHQGLGVSRLPFGHIYTPEGGLVEEVRITRPHFSNFAHKLECYVNGSCQLDDGDTSSPYHQEESSSESQEDEEENR